MPKPEANAAPDNSCNPRKLKSLLECASHDSLSMAAYKYPTVRNERQALIEALRGRVADGDAKAQIRSSLGLLLLGQAEDGARFLAALREIDEPGAELAYRLLKDVVPQPERSKYRGPNVPLDGLQFLEAMRSALADLHSDKGRLGLAFCVKHGVEAADGIVERAMLHLAASSAIADRRFALESAWWAATPVAVKVLQRLCADQDTDLREQAAARLLQQVADKVALEVAASGLLAPVPELNGPDMATWCRVRIEMAGGLRHLTERGDMPGAVAAAQVARNVIDRIVALPDPAFHISKVVGCQGLNDLMQACFNRAAADGAQWLAALSDARGFDAVQRGRALLYAFRLGAPLPANLDERFLQMRCDPGHYVRDICTDYAEHLGNTVLPCLLDMAADSDLDLATQAANALGALPSGPDSPTIVEALEVLRARGPTMHFCVDIAPAIAKHRKADAALLDEMSEWEAVPLHWEREGIRPIEAASMLGEALGAGRSGHVESVCEDDEAIVAVYKMIYADPDAVAHAEDGDTRESAFDALLGLLRPPLSELNPDPGGYGVPDVNRLLGAEGRSDRMFEITDPNGGAMYFTANGAAFLQVVKRLRLPVVPHHLFLG